MNQTKTTSLVAGLFIIGLSLRGQDAKTNDNHIVVSNKIHAAIQAGISNAAAAKALRPAGQAVINPTVEVTNAPARPKSKYKVGKIILDAAMATPEMLPKTLHSLRLWIRTPRKG